MVSRSVEDDVGSSVLDSLQPLASGYVTLCKQTVTIIEARRNESVHWAAQAVLVDVTLDLLNTSQVIGTGFDTVLGLGVEVECIVCS